MGCFAAKDLKFASLMVLSIGALATVDASEPVAVFSDGRILTVDEIATEIQPLKKSNVYRVKGSDLVWNVSFNDQTSNTNFGFDDPVLGDARRALLFEVLEDIGDTVNSSNSATVRVFTSLDDEEDFAVGGTFFDLFNGVVQGDSQKAIIRGIDDFPDFPDLFIQVDFGHDYHETSAPVVAGKHDLYSKLKASVVRGMGVLTLTTNTGGSSAAGGVLTRTTWDVFLITGENELLFNSTTGAFRGSPSWLTGGAGGVFFASPSTVPVFGGGVPVYAPDPFTPSQSFIEWDNVPEVDGSVLSSPDGLGVMHREFTDFELGALKDIGYNVVVTIPTPTPGPQKSMWVVE